MRGRQWMTWIGTRDKQQSTGKRNIYQMFALLPDDLTFFFHLKM